MVKNKINTQYRKDALKITCDDMTVFTINGADKFSYDIGGNLTSNSLLVHIKTFDRIC